MNAHEQGFISSFVAKSRRERWRQLLSCSPDPKRRRKLIQTCLNGLDFDYLCALPGFESAGAAAVLSALRALGAPDDCYVISEIKALDGMVSPLVATLDQVVGHGLSTIVSCIPGTLAFFEGESLRNRYIFHRA